MWGFYPDAANPHRVGFLTVSWPRQFTYWVEPRWMADYAQLASLCLWPGFGHLVPHPVPPAALIVPAGPGAPWAWGRERHERAKVTCWQLTGNGWATSRRWLLENGEAEG